MALGLTPEQLVYVLCGAGDPQISPDGLSVVYVRSDATPDHLRPETQLWLLSGQEERAWQLTSAARQHGSPRWSPTGDEIAFTSVRDSKHGIYTISAFG